MTEILDFIWMLCVYFRDHHFYFHCVPIVTAFPLCLANTAFNCDCVPHFQETVTEVCSDFGPEIIIIMEEMEESEHLLLKKNNIAYTYISLSAGELLK